ncbi:GMC oxidoreductase family protein [Exophiala dermatitidis]
MRRDLFLAAAVVAVAERALAIPTQNWAETEPQRLSARNIVDQVDEAYDFVIVGGGLAGLVLGARLSEDSNHTVLVLEAGGNGDEYRDQIDVPGNAYYKSLWPTDLNWDFYTVPQEGANNTSCEWPRGKVLGGSSAINGLYMNRPGQIELNAWQDLIGDMDGADNWSWASFYAAMKKSETFTAPVSDVVQEAAITWEASSHGTNGPIHQSYPGYTFPYVGEWSTAVQTVGVEVTHDAYGGKNWGAYVATSAINPTNWTRSYSRSGYLDPLPPRANYDVLANAQVTRIIFNSSSPTGNLTASGVEYTRDGGATKLTVGVKKEVILAAGTVGSPTVLMHSGVGPKDVLTAAGVEVLSELPGVGQHLQDHVSVSLQWSTDNPTAGSMYADNDTVTTTAAYLSYVNSAVAYVNSSVLFGNSVSSLKSNILSQFSQFATKASSDENVVSGYKAIYDTTANDIFNGPTGLVELLVGNNVDGAIRIGAALQHPFSHGSITINSSNPLDYPVIDPRYLTHPADVQILREGIKLARRIGEAQPLASEMKEEVYPGSAVQTDEEWEEWMRSGVFTEFHPSSTCSMLPLDQGGVVDANLRVYGLANVRVADASVPPIAFSAHLMGSTYGLAEQASTLIRAYHNKKIPVIAHTSSNNSTDSSHNKAASTTTAVSVSTATSSSSATATNGASSLDSRSWSFITTVAAFMVSTFVFSM